MQTSDHGESPVSISKTPYLCANDDPKEGPSRELKSDSVTVESSVEYMIDKTVLEKLNSGDNFPKIMSTSVKTQASGGKIFDTHQYSKNIKSAWFTVEGRRIVDWTYATKCLLEAQRKHSQACPGLLCMMDEMYRSMISTMILKCDICEAQFKVRTEEPSETPQLRRNMVWATLCSGGTFNSTKELLTLCNIPFMPFSTFISDEMEMDIILEEMKEISLSRAVLAEKQASYGVQHSESPESFSNDQRDPVKLSVALDGSWATRSYGKRFNSASGCGVIIGEKSKKILFAGCRNKRCSACNRARLGKKDDSKTSHRCFKNYSGSSGGMESDIMIEGFQKLMDNGIWLTTITTDGDSTTVAKLKNAVKYGASIEHQLCCNHVTKNCGKKLREVSN